MNIFQKQLSGLRHKQQLLYIMLFSLVTVVIWMVISVVTSQRQTGIDPELLRLAEPLNPNIDVEAIFEIEAKRQFSESELANFPIYKIIRTKDGKREEIVTIDVPDDSLAPTPTPTPSPVAAPIIVEPIVTQPASSSANPSASPSAGTAI